jgi:glycosyltransferase involved in cell wall biosynthesis
MRISVASLIDLAPLAPRLDQWDHLEDTWGFPYISVLVEALLERDHQVHVVALNGALAKPIHYSGSHLEVDVLPMRPHGSTRARDAYRVERGLIAAALQAAGSDVVHAHWTYEFGAGAVASGLPNVVTAHHSPWATVADARLLKPQLHGSARYLDAAKNAARETVRASLSEWVVAKADVVTAVAPNVQAHLSRLMFPRQPVELIPNGFRPRQGAPVRSLQRPSEPVFAFIGNGFGARKNAQTAVRALALLRKDLPGARLLLMGVEHDAGGPGQVWARGEGIDSNCEWLGEIPNHEVTRILEERVDVLVHTSRWEACSIAIMEAQSMGIPVIGGERSGGVPYSLAYGKAGLLVDVTSSERVADAMLRLCTSPVTFHEISIGSLRAIASTFNLEHVLDAYEEAYGRAIRMRSNAF